MTARQSATGCLSCLKKAYGELGFIEYTAEPEPEFKAAANSDSEGVVDFKVYIEEGQRFRIQTIKFLGSGLADEELLKVLKDSERATSLITGSSKKASPS